MNTKLYEIQPAPYLDLSEVYHCRTSAGKSRFHSSKMNFSGKIPLFGLSLKSFHPDLVDDHDFSCMGLRGSPVAGRQDIDVKPAGHLGTGVVLHAPHQTIQTLAPLSLRKINLLPGQGEESQPDLSRLA